MLYVFGFLSSLGSLNSLSSEVFVHLGDQARRGLVSRPVIVSTHMLHHIICSAEGSWAARIWTLMGLLVGVNGANMALEMLTASELSGGNV